MATGTGIDAQVGYKIETAYGTGVTVDTFLPFISESLGFEQDRIESDSILAGRQVRTSEQWARGNATVAGDVQHELYTQSVGPLLHAAFGTVNTTGTAVPYTHEFWPAAPATSFTAQVGRPATYGSVIPFTYTGCKIQSWELAAQTNEYLTWGMTLVAQDESRGTTLATASYASGLNRYVFDTASVKIDGTIVPVKSFKVSGDNSLADDRRFLGSTLISEPLRNDLAAITGEMEVEWGNPTAMGTLGYDRFVDGTESAFLATWSAGTLSGTIAGNVRYDGATPQVGDRGIVGVTIPIVFVASGADNTAIKVTVKDNATTV